MPKRAFREAIHGVRSTAVDPNEEALIEGTLAGRRQDFDTLIERHQKALYSFILGRTRDRAVADEIVQAAFVRAYTRLRDFRGRSSFRTWLHQIALNLCRSHYRSGRRRREVALDDVPDPASPVAGNAGEGAALRASLDEYVQRLPPRQRSVLGLRVFGDLSFRDIARIERISENAAKVNYHHAVTRLKKWLSSDDS